MSHTIDTPNPARPRSSSIDDVAKRHGVSKSQIYTELQEGRLESIRIGRRRLQGRGARRRARQGRRYHHGRVRPRWIRLPRSYRGRGVCCT